MEQDSWDDWPVLDENPWATEEKTYSTQFDEIGTEYWCPTVWESHQDEAAEENYIYEINSITTEEPKEEEEEVNVWAECDARMFPILEEEEDKVEPTINQEALRPDQVQALKELLDEFSSIFTMDLKNKPRCKIAKHKINTGDANPIRCRPYRYSPQGQQFLDEEVKKMLDADIIRPSDSPWCFPVVLVTKKNGKQRCCIDFRKLNAVTKLDAYPLPLIDEIFDALHGAKYFTTLDATSGYWQIEIVPEDQEKTAFVT